MQPSLLEVERVSKAFGGLRAIRDISLRVERGAIIGIMGPNGAGKTTLFNLISGFLRPDEGAIRLMGEEIGSLPPHRIALKGLVRSFQDAAVFPTLSLVETTTLACLPVLKDMSKARLRALETLDEIGLSGDRDRLPGELSLPDRKLLEVGRCLAAHARLILLDEVMAGLSRAEADRVMNTIRRVREGRLTSFLIVEHVMPILLELVDSLIVLDAGSVIAVGTPEEVVTNIQVQTAYLGKRT